MTWISLPARGRRARCLVRFGALALFAFLRASTIWATDPPNPQLITYAGRLSNIASLPDGRLVSMYNVNRPFREMALDGPEQPAYIRFSTDDGSSWTEPRHAFSYSSGKGCVGPGILPLVDRDGSIHAFSARYYQLPRRGDRTHRGLSELLHSVSRDGGITWSAPQKIDFGHTYSGAFTAAIELRSGRLLLAMNYDSDHHVDERGEYENRIVTVYSDDTGRTWNVGADNISVPAGALPGHPGAIEPALVELRDGRVWMLIRTQTLRFYQSVSSDGGKTWDKPSSTKILAPNSPGALLRLSDGRLVLCWNDVSQYPQGVTGNWRQYLFMAVSTDDGKTWSQSRLIAPVNGGDRPGSRADYPFLCEARNKRYLLVGYLRFGTKPDATYDRPEIELVRVDMNLMAGQF